MPAEKRPSLTQCHENSRCCVIECNPRALIGPAAAWFTRRRGQTFRVLAYKSDDWHRNIEPNMQGLDT